MSRVTRRYYRTILLGICAMAALIWVAVQQFGISRQEITQLFLGTVLVALLVIAGAALMTVLWVGLRRLLRRSRD